MVAFFNSTWFNPGIYLAIPFLPNGQKKTWQIFYPVAKKEWLGQVYAWIKPGRMKKHDQCNVWRLRQIKYIARHATSTTTTTTRTCTCELSASVLYALLALAGFVAADSPAPFCQQT